MCSVIFRIGCTAHIYVILEVTITSGFSVNLVLVLGLCEVGYYLQVACAQSVEDGKDGFLQYRRQSAS